MKIKALVVFLIILNNVSAQTPTWLWARSAGISTAGETGYQVTIDSQGNVYVIGIFNGYSITFGSYTLINADAWAMSNDIFVVKYSPTGTVLWAKRAGSALNEIANSISTDPHGNIIITGRFESDSITFGSYTLFPVGGFDIFMTKYDSSGNVLWAKCVGGNYLSFTTPKDLFIDSRGNIFLTGTFMGFTGNTITFGNDTLVNTSMFVAKFDSLGNPIWGKGANGPVPNTIYVDESGNVVIAGWINGNTTIGNINLNGAGASDMFIAKYDSSGNLRWAKSAGGAKGDKCNGISISSDGSIYATGQFVSVTIIFGNDTLTNVTSNTADDIFIAKYDSLGNHAWARSRGSAGGDEGIAITNDGYGNAWITGYILDGKIFVEGFDASGNSVCADTVPSVGIAFDIHADAYNNLLLTGWYRSLAADFGTNTIYNSDNTGNSADIFIAKFNCGIINKTEEHTKESINVFPNPVTSSAIIKVNDSQLKNAELIIYDIFGKEIISKKLINDQVEIEKGNMRNGVYFVKLKNKQRECVQKLIVE